jgi:hypothetical protein
MLHFVLTFRITGSKKHCKERAVFLQSEWVRLLGYAFNLVLPVKQSQKVL